MTTDLENLIQLKSGRFDVFLCHNSEDKPTVREIANQLIERGILPWLDEWSLRPGIPWQDALCEQIEKIGAAAVFVGSSGTGPWQKRELNALLQEFVERGCIVIPVLLVDAPSPPILPLFLKGMTWVNYKQTDPDPLDQLSWGITGRRVNTRDRAGERFEPFDNPIRDGSTMHRLVSEKGLLAHSIDGVTMKFSQYPKVLSVQAKKRFGTPHRHLLSLVGGEEAMIEVKEKIYAIDFTYQQGISQPRFQITLGDGSSMSYEGEDFFPALNFFGFYSEKAIKELHVATDPTGGSFIMWAFAFHALRRYAPDFKAEYPLT